MTSEERKIQELPETSSISLSDQIIVEDEDGTKLVDLATVKKLVNANFVVENVEAMKSASFKEGEVCITMGYRTAGDGGGAMYKIVYEPALVEDKANVIYLLTSDVNRAKFISLNNCVTPEQFGAVGDGSKDDSDAFKKCIASKYKIICRKNATYYVGGLPLANNLDIDLNGATLVSNGRAVFKATDMSESFRNVHIHNGQISGPVDTAAGIVAEIISSTRDVVFENLICENLTTGNSFLIGNYKEMVIRNCRFECGSTSGTSCLRSSYSTSTITSSADSLLIESCSFGNFATPIQVRGKTTEKAKTTTISNDYALDMIDIVSCSASRDTFATGTAFVTVSGGCTVRINSCRSNNLAHFANIGGNVRNIVSIDNAIANNAAVFIISNNSTDQVNTKISVNGSLTMSAGPGFATPALYKITSGTLFIGNADYNVDFNTIKESLSTGGTLDQDSTLVRVFDRVSAENRDIVQYAGTSAVLDISSFGKISNFMINLSSSSGNITDITGGVVGQVIRLVSSGNRTIVNNSTSLRLSESSIRLTAFKSITLKKINASTWAQI